MARKARIQDEEQPQVSSGSWKYGPCREEDDDHAKDCPGGVDHVVTQHQCVGSDRFISVQCKIARMQRETRGKIEKIQKDLQAAMDDTQGELFAGDDED